MTDQILDNAENCANCGNSLSLGALVCKECNTIVHQGKASSEDVFFTQKKIGDKRKAIGQARNILFILAAYILVFSFVKFRLGETFNIQNIFIGAAYVILGVFTRKNPILCFSLALLVYISTALINYLYFDFDFIATGIFIHFIVIMFLVWGLWSSIELERLKRELYGQ